MWIHFYGKILDIIFGLANPCKLQFKKLNSRRYLIKTLKCIIVFSFSYMHVCIRDMLYNSPPKFSLVFKFIQKVWVIYISFHLGNLTKPPKWPIHCSEIRCLCPTFIKYLLYNPLTSKENCVLIRLIDPNFRKFGDTSLEEMDLVEEVNLSIYLIKYLPSYYYLHL